MDEIVVGLLAVLGGWVLLLNAVDSWKLGRLFRLRQRLRAWAAGARVAPLWSLRFWLGVRLMRPRLDAMAMHFGAQYDADHDNEYALHHVHAIHKLRNWRQAVDEQVPLPLREQQEASDG